MFENIKEMNLEQLETRLGEIITETAEANEERLAELNSEMAAIEERKAEIKKAEIEERKLDVDAVKNGAGEVIEKIEERKDEKMEVRNSKEYMAAYAEYIKTGDDTECRSLLTENVENGVVPVPEFVENRVRQAWENDRVFARVSKTFVRGNLKLGFEVSATDAEIHVEGDTENPKEETLVLGVLTMVPQMIKKWITVSDEVLALGAESFLAYIYDELTYKIIQKAADIVIDKIQNAPDETTTEGVGVAKIDGDVTAETILEAMGTLGDDARDNVIVASGATITAVKKAALNASFAYDPFFGLTVIQKEGVEGAIIGDLGGVQANLPEGETVRFKFDDLSLAEKDLVKIVGRLYAAIEVVAPKTLAVIKGGESE